MDAKQLLDKYRIERQALIVEIRSLQTTILRMEADLGLEPEGAQDTGLGLIEDLGFDRQPANRIMNFAGPYR